MATSPNCIKLALQVMEAWLGLPEFTYRATVYLFAEKLPPEEILNAVNIAQAKIPDGGMGAFKYFCGVCHGKIREQRIRASWDNF